MVKSLERLILAIAVSIIGLTASAQTTGTCSTITGITTCNYAINDDGYAVVPIPFGFPFYGRVFTHSIMFDNGVVSFYDPKTEAMRLGGQNFFAQPLSNNIGSNFHYSIMPLWTDLRNYSGKYFTETDGVGFLRYSWEDISQFGYPSRLNSFDLEIRPTGYIGINYEKIDIIGYSITVGTVGNAQLGEWEQQYYKPPADTATISSIQNWSLLSTEGTDCSDPLNNQYCPGYEQAYFEQQCSINTLYNPSCPGYAVAYYDYQCSLSALYHTGCPGYEIAYFEQQCGLNPLYNELCSGYDDAYYIQQCNLDALYDSGCDGFTEAYAEKYILDAPIIQVEDETPIQTTVETTVTASPADTTAAVQLVAEPAASATVSQTTTAVESPRTESTAPAPRTTRQALAAQRLAAARQRATDSARENPNAMSDAMDSAESMEQQVDLQNVVLGAMSFVPGFDAYGASFIPDGVGYKPFTVYDNQTNVDNTRMLRGLSGASDSLHKQMIDSQYK